MKYVLVGAGSRGLYMFAKPMVEELSDVGEIVGIYDTNAKRSEVVRDIAGLRCPVYTDFESMIVEQRPDSAIIASVDCTHDYYIIKCLEAGGDYNYAAYRMDRSGVLDPGWVSKARGWSNRGMCFGPDAKLYWAWSYLSQYGGVERTKTDMTSVWEDFVYLDTSFSNDVEWVNVPGRITGHVDLQDFVPGTSPVAVTMQSPVRMRAS